MYDLEGTAKYTISRVEPSQRFIEEPVSLINLASVADLAGRIGKPIDPLRFRANIYFDELPALSEMDLQNSAEIRIGDARLRVLYLTQRCSVTEVDPVSAKKDLAIPKLIKEHYGHGNLVVYAEVVGAGSIVPGAPISY